MDGTDLGVEPVGVEPVGVEPVGVEPVGVEPVGVEPFGNEEINHLGAEQPSDVQGADIGEVREAKDYRRKKTRKSVLKERDQAADIVEDKKDVNVKVQEQKKDTDRTQWRFGATTTSDFGVAEDLIEDQLAALKHLMEVNTQHFMVEVSHQLKLANDQISMRHAHQAAELWEENVRLKVVGSPVLASATPLEEQASAETPVRSITHAEPSNTATAIGKALQPTIDITQHRYTQQQQQGKFTTVRSLYNKVKTMFGAQTNADPEENQSDGECLLDISDCLDSAAHDKMNNAGHRQIFPDGKQMKDNIINAIRDKEYHVSDYYYTDGFCQMVARSSHFENITLAIISVNALWIAIEIDNNDAPTLAQADAIFIIMENLFCVFFVFELCVRFGAFVRKADCLLDAWFVFDSCLVFSMMFETWFLTALVLVTGQEHSAGDAGFLRLLRLMRLTRCARIVRLLRCFPELIVLTKGVYVGMPAVFFTVVLLLTITYMFAIVMVQLSENSEELKLKYFDTVPDAVKNLLIQAGCPDLNDFFSDLEEGSGFYSMIFLLYWLVASVTLLNMLIGVLVEVIAVISSVEKDELMVNYINEEFRKHLHRLEWVDGDPITKNIFRRLLGWNTTQCQKHYPRVNKNCDVCTQFVYYQESIKFLKAVGIDVVALVDQCDVIFKTHPAGLQITDVIKLFMDLRGSNNSSVKDIVDLRKFVDHELELRVNKLVTFIGSALNRPNLAEEFLRDEPEEIYNPPSTSE